MLHVFTFCWLLNKNTVQNLLWSGQTRSSSQSGKRLLSRSKFYYIIIVCLQFVFAVWLVKIQKKKEEGIFNQYALSSLSSIYYAASAIIIVEVDLCLLQLVVYHTQHHWRGKFRTVFADANWGQNKKCLVYLIFAGLALTAASRFPTACHFSKAHYETYYSTLITFRAAGGESGLTWTSSGVHLGGLITSELCLISNGSCIPVERVEERRTSRGSRMSVFLYEWMWLHASTALVPAWHCNPFWRGKFGCGKEASLSPQWLRMRCSWARHLTFYQLTQHRGTCGTEWIRLDQFNPLKMVKQTCKCFIQASVDMYKFSLA